MAYNDFMKSFGRTTLICAPLLVGIVAVAQQPLSRYEQMKKLEGYVGTWNLSGKLLIPDEFKGMPFEGTVKIGWTLNHTALEFKASTKKSSQFIKPMEASGVVAFNDEGKPEFTASFAWSEDGRMLPLHGDFKGKTLVLEGASTPKAWDHVQLRVKATDTKEGKSWDTYVADGDREDLFIKMKLTKAKTGAR